VLSTSDFTFVRELVRARSGVVLDEEKGYLADSRLRELAREVGFDSATDVVAAARAGRTPSLAQKLVEAMMTNETSFFRDGHPFEALRTTILPELLRRRAAERRLTIWCGACSTGQEPYSIAILLREHFPSLSAWDVRITGVDLDAEVLARARAGRYRRMEMGRGLPLELRTKYFDQDGTEWVLRGSVRKAVDFRQTNLLADAPPTNSVDVVFLRNVLIYFDVPTKRAVLERVHASLRPNGVLFLGGTETTWNIHDGFARIVCGRTHFFRPLTGGSTVRTAG
jgi:chemotaxis protein methyltransferase CheR